MENRIVKCVLIGNNTAEDLYDAIHFLKQLFHRNTNFGIEFGTAGDGSVDFTIHGYTLRVYRSEAYYEWLHNDSIMEKALISSTDSPLLKYAFNQARFSVFIGKDTAYQYSDLNLSSGNDKLWFTNQVFLAMVMTLVRLYGDTDEEFASKVFETLENIYAINGHHKKYLDLHKKGTSAYQTFYNYLKDDVLA